MTDLATSRGAGLPAPRPIRETHPMRRLLLPLAGVVLAVAAAACGQAEAAPGGSSGSAASSDPNAPTIVAKDLKFEQSSYGVPAGKAFTLTFDNRDGAPHNITIAKDEGFGQTVFQGEIFGGPSSKAYSVPTLAAGTYYFRCDVHPDMKGTLVAK
jgi:plastocyanin